MAYIQPTSEVWLCSNVPLDPSYDNTLTFTTTVNNRQVWDSAAQRTYFASKAVYHPQNFSIVKERDGVLRMSGEVSKFYNINYMFFVNPTFETSQLYSGKYFYAFVTQVQEVNPNTTFVYFELDYYQTWAAELQFMESVIEREHVSDDSMYKHLEDEGIQINDMVPYAEEYFDSVLGDKILVVGASKSYEQIKANESKESYKIIYNPYEDYPFFGSGADVLDTIYSYGINKIRCFNSDGNEIPYSSYQVNDLSKSTDIVSGDKEIVIIGAKEVIYEIRFSVVAYYLGITSDKQHYDEWYVKGVGGTGGVYSYSRDGIRIPYNAGSDYPTWALPGYYTIENFKCNGSPTKVVYCRLVYGNIDNGHFVIDSTTVSQLHFEVKRKLLSDAEVNGTLSGSTWTFTDGS